MGDLIEYHSPREREEFTAYVGMLVFLGSWAMLFCGLFMAYGLLRSRSHLWPPAFQPAPPLGAGALITLLLLASSGLLQSGLRAVREGAGKRATQRVALATALGAAFSVGQVAIGVGLHRQGLTLNSSPFGSIYYGLTFIHLLHVAVGLVALGWLTVRVSRGLVNPARHLALRLWAMYWHFVGVVWLVMYVAVFVL